MTPASSHLAAFSLQVSAPPDFGPMCPPQAQAELGPTMTEKAEVECARSPVPTPPPKPASPGPLSPEELDHRGVFPARLPPGVPVISLGHTRPLGVAMPTTERGVLRPPLLHLSTLAAAPPALALHYHPHPFLNRSVGAGRGCKRQGGGERAGPQACVTCDPFQCLHRASRALQHLPRQPAEAETQPL